MCQGLFQEILSHLTLTKLYEIGLAILFTLHMRKMRHREVIHAAQQESVRAANMDPGGCTLYHYATLPLISTHTHPSHSIKLVLGRSIFTVHCVLCKSSVCLTGIWCPRPLKSTEQ